MANQNQDSLISFGGAVKAIGTDGRIAGYVAVFTSADEPDFDGEFFTKETDFGVETDSVVKAKFDHGLDMQLGDVKIGEWTSFKTDEFGLWAEGVIDRRNKYNEFIYQQVLAGEMQASCGTKSVQKEGAWLKSFPLDEISLTPTPCGYKTSVVALKTYKADNASRKSLFTDKLEAFNKPYLYELVEALESAYYQLNQLINASTSLNIPLDANKVWADSVEDFADKAKELGNRVFAGNAGSSKSLELDNLRVNVPFSVQSKAVRDTAEEFARRASEIADLRDADGKQKRFNEERATDFNRIAESLTAAADRLKTLLNPATETVETTADAAENAARNAERLKKIEEFRLQLIKADSGL